MIEKYIPFGLRHEISKRWTPLDWLKSKPVSNLINVENSDFVISNFLASETCGLIGRLGGTEARFLGQYYKIKRFGMIENVLFKYKPNWRKRRYEMSNNAGYYFSSFDDLSMFVRLYDQALKETDILGAWGTAFSWIESQYINKSKPIIPVDSTTPWVESYSRFSESIPWSRNLEGKKILVISPFSESILAQHKRIKSVFQNIKYPDYNLNIIKAPLTTGFSCNASPTWMERIDEMKDQMQSLDFDIALISAGAYSYPLAHHAKNMKRIGIHCGGGLQLFFGIMGRRWEKKWGEGNYYESFVNNSWVRPSVSETPVNAKEIEDGCYW